METDLSNWGDAQLPRKSEVTCGWELIRASHIKPTVFCCVSDVHYGVYTHYFQRRTMPHLQAGCAACDAGLERRWLGYLLGILQGNKRKIIFEFTPAAAEKVVEVEGKWQSLRGAVFSATRTANRNNGKVQLDLRPGKFDPSQLPPAEPIKPILARIWGYQKTIATRDSSFDPEAFSEDQRIREGLRNPDHFDDDEAAGVAA